MKGIEERNWKRRIKYLDLRSIFFLLYEIY